MIVLINIIKKIKDPVSCLTHMAGAIASIIGLVFLLQDALKTGQTSAVVGFSIFGASLILLYTASTVYHMLDISEKVNKTLRKVDHMMIFVLIAGTYTPICLIALKGTWGWTILSVIWTVGIAGMILKIVWIDAPRWVSTAIYIIMGWMIVIAIYPLSKVMPQGGLMLLGAGGLFYTVGAVIYGFKWPKFNFKYFGFHDIFHIFVLAGSLSHFFMMYYVI